MSTLPKLIAYTKDTDDIPSELTSNFQVTIYNPESFRVAPPRGKYDYFYIDSLNDDEIRQVLIESYPYLREYTLGATISEDLDWNDEQEIIEVIEYADESIDVTKDNITTVNNTIFEVTDKTSVTLPNHIALMGDSIVANAWSTSGALEDSAWGTWARKDIAAGFVMSKEHSYALGGSGVDNLLDVQLPRALRSGCGLVVIAIGTNDVDNGYTAAEVIGPIELAMNECLSAGRKVIFSPIIATADSAERAFTVAEKATVSNINRYLYNLSVKLDNVYYISTLDVMSKDGAAIEGYLVDGIHHNKNGAYIYGKTWAERFNNIFAIKNSAKYDIGGGAYDATHNPNGNILDNRYMTGTSGTLGGSATGDVADGYLMRLRSGTGTGAIVGAKVEDSEGVTWQQMTISGTATTTNNYNLRATTTLPVGWEAGDKVKLGCRIKCSGLSNVQAVSVLGSTLADDDASGISDGSETTNYGAMPSDFEKDYEAEYTLDTAEDTIWLFINVNTTSYDAHAGVISVTDCYIERIEEDEEVEEVILESNFDGAIIDNGYIDGFRVEGNNPVLNSTVLFESDTSLECRLQYTAVGENYRCEIAEQTSNANYDDTYIYRVVLKLPDDYQADGLWEVITQWHGETDDGEPSLNPPLALVIRNGNWELTYRTDDKPITTFGDYADEGTIFSEPVETGRWIAWEYEIKWDYNSNGTGVTKVRKNGELIVDRRGPNCFNDVEGPYFKAGLYKGWKDSAANVSTDVTVHIAEASVRKVIV